MVYDGNRRFSEVIFVQIGFGLEIIVVFVEIVVVIVVVVVVFVFILIAEEIGFILINIITGTAEGAFGPVWCDNC